MAHSAAAALAALFLGASVFAQNVALRLLLLGLGLLAAGYVSFRSRERVAWLPPVWLPFLLWAAWSAASLIWSVDPQRSLKEWRNEVFYTGSALWMCFVAAQARDAARIILPLLALAALAACTVALWDFSQGLRQYRSGWHGGPADHSSALVTLMPCALIAGWYARRIGAAGWLAAASWSLAALFLVSAYATYNRMVWAGFGAEFLALGAMLVWRSRAQGVPSPAPRTRLAFALTVIAAAGTMLFVAQAQKEEVRAARGKTMQEHRAALWPEIVERIAERPLSGHGFGRGLLRESLQEDLGDRSRNLWHAHNLFLDVLLQGGVAGLALFLLLLGVIVRQGWRAARDADPGTAAAGMALVAVVAGMAVRNLTDTLLYRQNALLFWGVTGVLLAWSATAAASRRR